MDKIITYLPAVFTGAISIICLMILSYIFRRNDLHDSITETDRLLKRHDKIVQRTDKDLDALNRRINDMASSDTPSVSGSINTGFHITIQKGR